MILKAGQSFEQESDNSGSLAHCPPFDARGSNAAPGASRHRQGGGGDGESACTTEAADAPIGLVSQPGRAQGAWERDGPMTTYTVVPDGVTAYDVVVVSARRFLSMRGFPKIGRAHV